MIIPFPTHSNEIMDENGKVKTDFPSVVEREGEINELVYKLYGLNEDDIEVIEDFLSRF